MTSRMWTAALLVLMLAGCAKHHPTAPQAVADAGPAANSPENAVRRLVWGLVHRDTTAYTSVLTDDFLFVFAPNDSAGNAWRNLPWDHGCEVGFARHLFCGGSDLPPASDVSIAIDSRLSVAPDTRPGRTSTRHKTIRTHVDLKVTVTDISGTPSVTPVNGYLLFYLTRGDSAVLSPQRSAAGGGDSTRWYVDRWDDLTVGTAAPGLHPLPSRAHSLGSIKVLYR